MALTLVCNANNDLCRILQDNNVSFNRVDDAREAIEGAPESSGILILADGYPDTPTPIDLAVLKTAHQKNQRVYLEFPSALPEMDIGDIHGVEWERAAVASDVFPSLEKLRILMIHGCRYVSVQCEHPHIVLARIAGFDHAVYGLPDQTAPILFEHPHGNLLVATTKLSQFQTARYAPSEARQTIWQWILSYITHSDQNALAWKATVRPTYQKSESPSTNTEPRAIQRGVQWFHNAKLLVHPDWQTEANRRVVEFPDGTGIGPEPDWPTGDGTCGMIEGPSSRIHPDGSQDWRYFLRNDCMGEAAMAMAFGHELYGQPKNKTTASNLNDFIYIHSDFAGGPRGDPDSPSYGLVRWTNADGDGVYYGDDNARSMLGTMAVSALLDEPRWNEPLLRCLLANLRTTGPQGFRSNRLNAQDTCGAIREELGESDRGSYGAPKTNEAYGTSEAPLIQENGDPLCDLLYTTNFAFVGLHEAAAVTGDTFYRDAEDQLADFLCRIQVTSETRPELDGAWFRAFDFDRWDYWASNADLGWGAWCVESGWTQGWITSVLAMRQLNTSLWDLTRNNQIGQHLDSLVAEMLPEQRDDPFE